MSAAVSRYIRVVVDDPDCQLSTVARHLLAELGHFANRQGHAWPSIDTLARHLAVTARTVQRARAELVAAGVIAVDVGGGRGWSSSYRFPALRLVGNGDTRDTDSSAETVTPGARKGDTGVVKGDTGVTRRYSEGLKTAPASSPAGSPALCAPDCPDCDGTGFVAVPDPRGGTAAAPCPRRRSA